MLKGVKKEEIKKYIIEIMSVICFGIFLITSYDIYKVYSDFNFPSNYKNNLNI